jgi:hypothetical protein
MKMHQIVDKIGWNFDQISAIPPDSLRWQRIFDEDLVLLRHQIQIEANFLSSRSEWEIELWWGRQTDFVFWELPPKRIYPRAIFFSSFSELAQWVAWSFRARFLLDLVKMDQIQTEIESLKVKFTAPCGVKKGSDQLVIPMTSTLELL